MSQNELIHAWKAGRQSQSPKNSPTEHPAGSIDLSDADLEAVSGGRMCLPGEASYYSKWRGCRTNTTCRQIKKLG